MGALRLFVDGLHVTGFGGLFSLVLLYLSSVAPICCVPTLSVVNIIILHLRHLPFPRHRRKQHLLRVFLLTQRLHIIVIAVFDHRVKGVIGFLLLSSSVFEPLNHLLLYLGEVHDLIRRVI
jgi:hypothetical protein